MEQKYNLAVMSAPNGALLKGKRRCPLYGVKEQSVRVSETAGLFHRQHKDSCGSDYWRDEKLLGVRCGWCRCGCKLCGLIFEAS